MDDYFVVFSTGEYLSRVRGFLLPFWVDKSG